MSVESRPNECLPGASGPISSGFPEPADRGADGASPAGFSADKSANSPGRALRRPRPPKLYRIGEIVGYCGVSRQTIHNYATMGLIREKSWTAGGHRLFDESVFERLDRITQMKSDDKSLRQIRDYFARRDARRGGPTARESVIM